MSGKKPTVNFEVQEVWWMTCPHCEHIQKAPFNEDNPMCPKNVSCEDCGQDFILTYERDT